MVSTPADGTKHAFTSAEHVPPSSRCAPVKIQKMSDCWYVQTASVMCMVVESGQSMPSRTVLSPFILSLLSNPVLALPRVVYRSCRKQIKSNLPIGCTPSHVVCVCVCVCVHMYVCVYIYIYIYIYNIQGAFWLPPQEKGAPLPRRRENKVGVNMVLAEYHQIQTWLL